MTRLHARRGKHTVSLLIMIIISSTSAGRVRPAVAPVIQAIRARRTRARVTLSGLVLALIAVSVLCAATGAARLDPGLVVSIVAHHTIGLPAEPTWTGIEDAIVWITRMPRILAAIGTGAVLAVAGSVLQALVRNSLADPYLLGVNSGASTGAAAAILIIGGSSTFVLTGSAFLGATGAIILVLAISGSSGAARTPLRLIMAGMAVAYALSAVTSFIVFSSDSPEGARSVMFWLLGSLAAASWDTTVGALVAAFALTVAVAFFAMRLDAMATGDETALSLGLHPARTRLILMVLVSFGVGVVVAGAGSIGFVGLVVPHIARRLVGAGHRLQLPASALIGAVFLLLADLAARTLFAPHEMPIGVVTGVVGAPFLLALAASRRESLPRARRSRRAPSPQQKGPA